VYFFLTEAVRRRLIKELRAYWSLHPAYSDLAENVQGKYSFEERPQYGIILKTGSATKVQFAPDNFMGTVASYVALARIPGYAGLSVEWVREDALAIQANESRFPSQAGIYYCEMTSEDEFFVDPLLDVRDERITMTTNSEGTLQGIPFAGSLRVFEMPSARLLRPGTDYVVGADQVTIYLAVPLANGQALSADYRVAGTTTGPWKVEPQAGLSHVIPGVVLVFGRRYQKGDRWAVLVSQIREPAYLEYGGKWELSIDIDIIARDVTSQVEIADQTAMFLWAILRPNLIEEGIEIADVSMGGETEEIYDETGDDYFYNSSISMTVQADWFLHVPILPRILSYQEEVKNLPDNLSLSPFRDPFFLGKFEHFEKILG
jgi:hypothetical protein